MPRIVTDTNKNFTTGSHISSVNPVVKINGTVVVGGEGVPLVADDIWNTHSYIPAPNPHVPKVLKIPSGVVIGGLEVCLDKHPLDCGDIANADPNTKVFIGGIT